MQLEIKDGIKDSVPFGIGFIFLYLAIGMLGATNSFSFMQMLTATVLIFSTPLQFLLTQSGDAQNVIVLVPAILAMNVRFLLMSATLAPHFKDVNIAKLILPAIFVVPSIFTGCLIRFREHKKNSFLYFLSLGIPIYFISIVCTVVGFVMSKHFKSPVLYALMDIILPLQFTALVAKHWPDYLYIGAYWAGFLLTPFLIYFFHSYNLLLTPFIIGAFAVVLDNFLNRKGDE